ncbi:unnamed protein product [Rotaria sordida]|uniref:NADH dehydrogenase [ubiquinone] 1 beta subcomplex subunit 7 n=1 Tax=Rotaria sordida TaxID=392033 RepID=A0A818TRS5_9BILA|nr:unnamed protein product [Rotaria sordida]CAF1001433.1 unnamed protein product [Rotaria sordida]CAF3541956.1 unnamed protein product [Rotaria sordida]CAF3686975.1 unnamed protein product [Rotaria sordida]
MGLNISGTIDRARHPEQYPDKAKGPTFDPMYGFPDGRKLKTAPYTDEEMQILNIPHDKRDYCAHYFRAPERHAWEKCETNNKLDDAKEYERELCLRQRRLRKEEIIKNNPIHKELANNEE